MLERFAEEFDRDNMNFQEMLDGMPFGEKSKQKLHWSHKPRVKESLKLTVAQKVGSADQGESFQVIAKECLPAFEIPLTLINKLSAKFEEGSASESMTGFLLCSMKRAATGAYAFWEMMLAEDGSLCRFAQDFYPIHRVVPGHTVRSLHHHEGTQVHR